MIEFFHSRGRAHRKRGANVRFRFPLMLSLALGACGDAGPKSAPGPDSQTVAGIDWKKDKRLKNLMVECYGSGRFSGDTSDMLPVLVEKLQTAQRTVLRNVREELAEIGEPALVELERLIRRLYSDKHSSPIIVNALAVFRLSDDGGGETAQAVYTSCLGHPKDTIRIATIRALSDHSVPSLFDTLQTLLPISTEPVRNDLVIAMHKANPARMAELALQWLADGAYPELEESCARLLAGSADPKLAVAAAAFLPTVESPATRAYLAAAQEKIPGAVNPLALLETMLASDQEAERGFALQAVEFTSRTDWVVAVLQGDPSADLRARALSLLRLKPSTAEIHRVLTQALNDSNKVVREGALQTLLERGDERAADTALEMWSGNISQMEIAARATAGNWEANPGLAERALKLLVQRYEDNHSAELSKRESWVQAIAQIPGPESTRYLLAQARQETGQVKGYSAHRFFTLQASNTGPRGLDVLREAWRNESDEGRRFDLLWAGSVAHDDGTREFLIAALQEKQTLPHERLWIAERLAQEGPASRVAPLIKRANMRMSDPDFRPAMECLLWRWYG